MKINDLTEDSLKTLKETSYAVFKNNKLEDITLFKLNDWDRPFNDLYEEYGGSTLKSFKEQYKDCEMFELSLINKPVETTNEQPEYELEYININATDCPIKLTNLVTKETRLYGVEGLPWKLLRKDQEIMQYVFNNFKSDI